MVFPIPPRLWRGGGTGKKIKMLPTNQKKKEKEMLKSKFFLLVTVSLIFGVLASSSWAGDNHAMPMLRMGVGARALALGGAFVAEASDASAGYWNPAGLTQIEFISITGMYSEGMSFDRNYNFIAYGHRFNFGSLGLTWLNSGVKEIKEYNNSGTLVGDFDAADNVFLFSYGKRLDNFMAGASFKVVNQKIDYSDPYSETGFGFDFGLKFEVSDEVTFAAVAQDLGTKVGDDRIQTNLRFGAAIYPLDGFTFPVDVEKITDRQGLKFHFGGEYAYEFAVDYMAALRAGLNDGNFSIGVGFQARKWNTAFVIDYAYVTDTENFMGENHRISLTLNFF
jgi:hypothetical protein